VAEGKANRLKEKGKEGEEEDNQEPQTSTEGSQKRPKKGERATDHPQGLRKRDVKANALLIVTRKVPKGCGGPKEERVRNAEEREIL